MQHVIAVNEWKAYLVPDDVLAVIYGRATACTNTAQERSEHETSIGPS